jgi:hypothetical protein
MTMQNTTKQAHNASRVPNALAALAATDELALLKRPQLARAIGLSPRGVDNLTKRKIIPYIKISPRCVRFSLPAVLAALQRFEVKAVGGK